MADKDIRKLQGKRQVTNMSVRTQHDGDFEKEAAAHKKALERIVEGGIATRVRILASHDSCPVCRAYEGAYDFDVVPALPHEGCSHPLGCRCHYAPVLDRFGP